MGDAEWAALDRKALSVIRFTLAKNVAFNIVKETTTCGLMKALSNMYEKLSASNKVFLIRRLVNTRMREGMSVTSHINEFNTILSRLLSVDIKFEDEVQALLLLSSLPESWSGTVTAISGSAGTSKLTFEGIRDFILGEDIRRRSSGESSSALLSTEGRGRRTERGKARGRSKSRKRSQSKPRKDIQCWKCKETEHFRNQCPNRTVGNREVNAATDDSEYALVCCVETSTESWILDFGASFHATYNMKMVKNLRTGKLGRVRLADHRTLDITGIGDVDVKTSLGTTWTLKDVRVIPSLKKMLISVGQLDDQRYWTTFGGGQWKVVKENLVIARGKKRGTLYMVEIPDDEGMNMLVARGKLPDLKKVDSEFCESCVLGMKKKVSFVMEGQTPKAQKLELVYTDVYGPTPVSSLGGSNYYVTFIDDSTRKVWVYFLKNKFDVFNTFKKWKTAVELETDLKTVPGTPQQNGVAERMNRTLNERARSMRLNAGLPKTFWVDAVNTAAYLINRGLSVPLGFKIPEEEWKGEAVTYDHLKVFGCSAYDLMKDGDKLDVKAKIYTFIGYGADSMGYRLWDFESRKNQKVQVEFESNDIRVRGSEDTQDSGSTEPDVQNDDESEDVHEDAINNESSEDEEETDSLVKPQSVESNWVRRSTRVTNSKGRMLLATSQKVGRDVTSQKVCTSSLHEFDSVLGGTSQKVCTYVPRHSCGRECAWPLRLPIRVFVGGRQRGVSTLRYKGRRSQVGAGSESELWGKCEETVGEIDTAYVSNVIERLCSMICKYKGRRSQVSAGSESELWGKCEETVFVYSNFWGVTTKPPEKYDPSVNYLLLTENGEPESYSEAVKLKDSLQWEHAMKEEMGSLNKNKTWELTKLPRDKKALQNKWVFRIKEEHDGSKRYKARLVVKGFQQKKGIDYNEIFSPVVKMTTIRLVLSIVAAEGLHLEQLDVKTAFLHGDLDEDIYMAQPEGFQVVGKEDWVCKLKRSLYGLKQAPRQWYLKFDNFMERTGYRRCEMDHCCYVKKFKGSYIILLLYVDDMLIAGSDMKKISKLKKQMSEEFEMKDLGPAKQILGMSIARNKKDGSLTLSQEKYIGKALERFKMNDEKTKPRNTPLGSHFRLTKDQSPRSEEEKADMADVPYASAIGSLMYAMVCTRPDIAHAVGVVSRFMSDPGREHWEAVKWLLRYLKGTSNMGLCFKGKDSVLRGYTDADLGGSKKTFKSTTGYIFTVGGTAVSWMSRLQKSVALSTTEAEYMAVAEASKELVWLKTFLEELGKKQADYSLYCDNESVVKLAKNPVYHGKTKHIGMRYHFVRGLISDGTMNLMNISGAKNPADMFTKSVALDKLKFCMTSAGLQE
ncbi:hypothetical protein OSB04_015876 [Centaurea solstitialis]|uniref:Integrase catalytic domain-containing protein n=1 Tax=Centaurea solstitialis TaxID=347529 RepID=A0AA38TAZ1_9ASTR|nr:hypothetical protein OSB04_015876 [Centaurea solstitialis]